MLADDSGLCVRALGGEPGVTSNRFGAGPDGRILDTPKRNALLLQKLGGATDRAAYFVCCLVLVQDEARFIAVQETVHGIITDAPRGTNGFGYDPLFLVPGPEERSRSSQTRKRTRCPTGGKPPGASARRSDSLLTLRWSRSS